MRAISFLFLTLFVSTTFAGIELVQEAPATAVSGGVLEVQIHILNTGTRGETIVIRHPVGYEPISPTPIGVAIHKFITPTYYYWNLTLPPGGQKTVSFKERLIGAHGHYDIPPAIASTGDNLIRSNIAHVEIICNRNGICEASDGESFVTCPDDCHSGTSDLFCDEVQDGVCDPDCKNITSAFDPDCSCGNGICGPGETHERCPFDCKNKAYATPDFSYQLPAVVLVLGGAAFAVLFLVAAIALAYSHLFRKAKNKGKANKTKKKHNNGR